MSDTSNSTSKKSGFRFTVGLGIICFGIFLLIVAFVKDLAGPDTGTNESTTGPSPVAFQIEMKKTGALSQHTTPCELTIKKAFDVNCLETIDIWVPDWKKEGGGEWYSYKPKEVKTSLPQARVKKEEDLIYKFRRHEKRPWWKLF